VAKGVPTLVLNATLDPATPFQGGKNVFSHLDQGYHIYVDGGAHGSYGRRQNCPDKYVTNLLISGQVPDQKEIKCTWQNPVFSSYQVSAPTDASQIGDNSNLPQFILTTYLNILYTPELAFDRGLKGKVEVACPHGGKFSFELDKSTRIYNLVLTQCTYTKGFVMTGTGIFNTKNQDIGLDIDVSGVKTGKLSFKITSTPQSISLTGTYGGQTVNFQR
jgi:hypothetical protein